MVEYLSNELTLSEQRRQNRQAMMWQCVVTTSHGSVVSTQHLASGTMPCRKHCTHTVCDSEVQTVHCMQQTWRELC